MAANLEAPFQSAYERLLSRAPGPVFPRARALYFCKYSLEQEPDGPFRTFLLEEELQEASGGAVRSRGLAFAVVHWHGPQIAAGRYATYLEQRWQLQPSDLTPVDDAPWFREGGAWARFSAAAVYERATPTTLVSPPAGRGIAEDAAGPSW
jgi:hypothetical protein